MIERRLIFEIHRMADDGLSSRKIAKNLHLDLKIGIGMFDPAKMGIDLNGGTGQRKSRSERQSDEVTHRRPP